jgi:diaminopimelate epimerase
LVSPLPWGTGSVAVAAVTARKWITFQTYDVGVKGENVIINILVSIM